jgi:hypothetical protein
MGPTFSEVAMGTRELHRRRLFAGVAMIVAPLAGGTAFLVAPQLVRDDTAGLLARFAEAPGRLEIALIVGLAAIALFTLVGLGLGHLLREDLPWYGQVGAVLAVTGMTLFAAVTGAVAAAGEAAQLDVGAATVTWDAMTSNPVMYVAVGGLVAAGIGYLVLATGLAMARTAPLSAAAGLAVGVAVMTVGVLLFSTPWLVVGFAVMFLGLAPLGYELLAEPDEAWEHPAHFDGMRPVLG